MRYYDPLSPRNLRGLETDRLLEDAGLTRLAGIIVERREDGTPRDVVEELTWLGRLVRAVRSRQLFHLRRAGP
jgi:hypothetical protein